MKQTNIINKDSDSDDYEEQIGSTLKGIGQQTGGNRNTLNESRTTIDLNQSG